MTEKDLAALIVGGWMFLALFAWAWALFMAVLIPVWMFGTLARLNNIRKELRRWNDRHDDGVPAPATDARPERHPIGAQLLGHQLPR